MMDCCNYMQYRHHQPYYGSQYYDPMPPPPYHGDFYGGQQMYPEYYGGGGNSPYYSQQWPCVPSFPDYVYSPKEARIRKAMRDATRDRSMGVVAPTLLPSRPGTRRVPHNWVSPHDELMMSPLVGMRATMESPICNFPFAASSRNSNQFMPSMNGYSKLESSMSTTNSIHPNYIQPNPLTQLQQHAEMWPDYQVMRPSQHTTTTGNHHQFMMPSDASTNYQYHQHVAAPPPPLASNTMLTNKSNTSPPPLHTNENIPPNNERNHSAGNGAIIIDEYDRKVECDQQHLQHQRLMGHQNNSMDGDDRFMNVYDSSSTNDLSNRHIFEKNDDQSRINKKSVASSYIRNTTTVANKKPSSKPLPDFNEAFGSTERGRFQCPPDPRLAPNKGYLDNFFDSSLVKFEDYQN